jgi:hypothetical protein
MRLACRPPVFEPQVRHWLTGIYPIYQCSHDCQSDGFVLTAPVPGLSTGSYLN